MRTPSINSCVGRHTLLIILFLETPALAERKPCGEADFLAQHQYIRDQVVEVNREEITNAIGLAAFGKNQAVIPINMEGANLDKPDDATAARLRFEIYRQRIPGLEIGKPLALILLHQRTSGSIKAVTHWETVYIDNEGNVERSTGGLAQKGSVLFPLVDNKLPAMDGGLYIALHLNSEQMETFRQGIVSSEGSLELSCVQTTCRIASGYYEKNFLTRFFRAGPYLFSQRNMKMLIESKFNLNSQPYKLSYFTSGNDTDLNSWVRATQNADLLGSIAVVTLATALCGLLNQIGFLF